MKLVKRISYFFVIPIFFLSLGIFIGVWGIRFFYPGSYPGRYSEVPADRADTSEVPESVTVTVSEETLCADTEYVLKETDILRNTSVETSWQIPHKYLFCHSYLISCRSVHSAAYNHPVQTSVRYQALIIP